LFVRRGGKWQALKNGDWPGSLARSAAAGADGHTWIADDSGRLISWNGQAFALVPLPTATAGTGPSKIYAMMVSREGVLWLGRDGEILRLAEGEWQAYALPNGEPATAMAQDAKGRMWFGDVSGELWLFKDNRLVDKTPTALRDCERIRCLLPGSDGDLWNGTSRGLARLREGECTRITTANGLNHNVVSQLLFDGEGNLWGAGNHGVFSIARIEWEAAFNRGASWVHCATYGRLEGLPSLQANSGFWPNALTDRDGRLWFATRSGIALVNTGAVGNHRKAPGASIEALILGRRSTNLSQLATPLEIPAGSGPIAFELGAASFFSSENVGVEHRLDGLDAEWQQSGLERTASYAHLPPGRYTLRTRAVCSACLWSDEAVWAFTVLPQWWETWWFTAVSLCLLAMVAVCVTLWLAAQRHRRQTELLRQEAAVERERARIARDIHDEVGASLTQISMLSELARDGATVEHLEHLAGTAREAVTALDGIVWAVNPQHDNLASLVDYIGQQSVDQLHAAGVRCRLEFPPDCEPRAVSAEFRHHLHLLVREAVHNAAKHSGGEEVRLAMEARNEGLHVSICDDGRGFDPLNAATKGNGLANMKNRTQSLGGECVIATSTTTGTCVTFILPWPAPQCP
ncbi:MAG: sensor histidine kinase, partial [Roseimicrobium sp.]